MIRIDNLTVSFGNTPVLSGLSCHFKKGRKTAVLAPSGAGKTTLINAILSLIPYEGVITVQSDKFAVVFQEDRLCEGFSVLKNVELTASDEYGKDDIKEGLAALGLKDKIHAKVYTLSGGMRRRVAIARALFSSYDILIMDEPFSGLDPETKQMTIDYVNKKTSEKTVLFITHDSSEAASLHSDIFTLLQRDFV